MGLFGKIGKAIGGAFKAVGNAVKEVGKQAALFAGGVVSGFVMKPVAGVVSLFSEDLASKIKLPWQEQIDNSFMGKVGSFTGTALGFVGGTALLRGVGMGATAARAAIGAMQGLGSAAEGSFWDKLKGAGFGALTAGVAGKLGDKVGGWIQKGEDAVLQPLTNAGAPRVVTQAADRVMDAQIRNLALRGRLADWDEIIPAAAVGAVVTEAGDHINGGIDKLVGRLPEGDVRTSVDRVLDSQVDSLARTGRFTDFGVAVSHALPDNLNQRIDALLNQVSDSDNRFAQTAGQFLDHQVDTFRDRGHFVDPGAAALRAASREFSPELDRVLDRTRDIDRVGKVIGNVLEVEANSLQQYGRLHNPGNAFQRAIMDEVRPELNRVGERLPGPARDAVSDMLDGFTINGMNGFTAAAETSLNQNVQQYAERVLSAGLDRAEQFVDRGARFDRNEARA